MTKKKQTLAKPESLLIFWLKTIALALLLSSCKKKSTLPTTGFHFNLPREFQNTDPLLVRGSAKKYILFNLHRGLFYYGENSNIISHGAKKCFWKTPLQFSCTLEKRLWSDGSPILSQHYAYSFKQIQIQKQDSLEVILNINSVTTVSDYEIFFNLKIHDPNFKDLLTDIRLTPRKHNKTYLTDAPLYSGPYKIKLLNSSKVILENNSYFDKFKRPNVIGVFIDSPSSALKLYETKKIDFLRYLETSHVPNYTNVLLSPIAKLDGLILNLNFFKDSNLRKALLHALDFKELKNIFHSKSTPGCLPVPQKIIKYDSSTQCFVFDTKKAQLYFSKVKSIPKKIKLSIPAVSYSDHIKFAEWVRFQWKKHLGLQIEIEQIDTKIFYNFIKKEKLSMYRKSLPLDYLDCFHAQSLLIHQPEFNSLQLKPTKSCKHFFDNILKTYSWLPLGVVHLPNLHSTKYSGYYINLVEQMGLEQLQKRSL